MVIYVRTKYPRNLDILRSRDRSDPFITMLGILESKVRCMINRRGKSFHIRHIQIKISFLQVGKGDGENDRNNVIGTVTTWRFN